MTDKQEPVAKMAARGRALAERLDNDSRETIAMTDVSAWIHYAVQLLAAPPAQPAQPMVPLSAMRAIAVEAIRAVTGCPDIRGTDGKYLVDEIEDVAKSAAAQPAPAQEPQRLWLWKNFVDGKPEYWAFDNAFPVYMDSDDAQTLGEPCGYAIFKPARQGRTDVSDSEVLRRIEAAIVPPGYVVVPVDATKEMCVAAVKVTNGDAVYKNVLQGVLDIEEEIYGEVYAAMIAAAKDKP